MAQTDPSTTNAAAQHSRGKYITLAILLAWVVAVFVFTLFKFSKAAG